jgi:1-acyl-sn-glycerol-3-phosphate acyltransferase
LIEKIKPFLKSKKLGDYIEEHNRSAVIFPEGTRVKRQTKEFSQTGLKILCKAAPSAYVVPVSINNSWKMVKLVFLRFRKSYLCNTKLKVSEFDFEELIKAESAVVGGIKF